ncbi:hypothetical protein D3C74_330180 [compost metagenome]
MPVFPLRSCFVRITTHSRVTPVHHRALTALSNQSWPRVERRSRVYQEDQLDLSILPSQELAFPFLFRVVQFQHSIQVHAPLDRQTSRMS